MKKTLVTGGNGLVGSQIKSNIKIGREFDLRNQIETDNMFKQHKPTHVIHCAGKVGGVGGNMNYKGEFFYDNIMINTNVIESCRKHDVTKLVTFLSTCIFPDKVIYPLTESKIHIGPPHNSNDAYAYAKRMSDIQIKAYREQYGLNYVSVIPTNIYGINDNFNLNNGHVIPSLIHKCYLAKMNNETFNVWGSGNPLREFIFNKDIAKITEWVLESYDEEEPIILSTSEEIPIKDVVYMIAEIMDYNGDIRFDLTKPDGQLRKPSDNSKLKSYLPDFKFTTLYDGLTETINWFIKNYEKTRK